MSEFWKNKHVCVTGGAAMIGAELCQQLIDAGVGNLWVADDLSAGRAEQLPKGVRLVVEDMRRAGCAENALSGADIVFHLACQHGGRGFVNTHRLACFDNLGLDSTVFRACARKNVQKVVFASSACVYPVALQTDPSTDYKLREDMVVYGDTRQADGAYGMAKLMAEQTLDAYAQDGIFNAVSCRFFTVFGRYVKMNHAIGALIAKTFAKQTPFEIWGDGTQVRNWTFVRDTARGMLLAAEKLDSGAVNIGVEKQITVNDAAMTVWKLMGWSPREVQYMPHAPVGTLNRVADATKARTLLGWTPQTLFVDGLQETINWFVATHTVEQVKQMLAGDGLTAR